MICIIIMDSVDLEISKTRERKKEWRKGTEHLLKRRLCQVCFELEKNDGTREDLSIKAVYNSSPNLESEEQAIRLSEQYIW